MSGPRDLPVPPAAPPTAASWRAARQAKLETLRARGIEPYPYAFAVTHSARQVLDLGEAVTPEPGIEVAVAGRLMARRGHGKAGFGHVLDASGKVQVYARADVLGEDGYGLWELLDIGDWVGVRGRVFRTRTGEITVQAQGIELLAKSMRPLPDKWHGLSDPETRYRQRYADLFMNVEVREVFRRRALLFSTIRRFLDGRGFLEVETPVLQPLYGGAFARPFTTHHNALDMDLYLRISNELYLKRCLVGGLERVYEFARDFRNEGIDKSHSPEFTMLEVYQAFADYRTIMRLTEEMIVRCASALTGGLVVEYQGQRLDFTPPWPEVSILDAVTQAVGEDVSDMDPARMARLCARHGLDARPGTGAGGMLDELFSALVQPSLVQPTFVVDHPREISPLAKVKRGMPAVTERFEPFVCGMEIGNAFSEQNDPAEQERQFRLQMDRKPAGDDEAQVLDKDYRRALEYGMPPTGGLGIGIDRLVMLLTDSRSIRDVVLVPALRPEEGRAALEADDDDGAGEAGSDGAGA
jgi:lysyl-tRNA synthetase class 2